MLERATSYFETAGRRFLRDSSGAIQARRCLSQHFWKHNIGGDAGHLLSALTQQPDQSSSLVQRSSRRNQSSNEANLPFLDFLYPLRAQELTTLRLSRLPKRVGLRRRKRTPTGLRRTYVSEAVPASQSQNGGQQDATQQNDTQRDNTPVEDDTNGAVRPVQAIKKLWKHLKAPVKNSDSYEIGWVIFLSAGRPPEALSEACAYFSRSNKPVNQERAWEIFSEMKDPSGDDFHNITHSQFQKDPTKLMQICHLALKFKRSRSTFAVCFKHFINNREWELAEEVWVLRSKFNDKEKGDIVPATWDLGISPEAILELLTSFEGDVKSRSRNLSKIAGFLLGRFSTSLWMLKDPPMETVSAIIQKSYSLGFLTLRHYDNMIRTLQTATVKADFTRSIICYRQMRQHFPEMKKCSFLPRQLELVLEFNMPSHVDYFLDEIRHFFQQPSLQHYRSVLNFFSRSGDVSKIHSLFDGLLADHGNPKSRKLMAPVLVAHAKIGDVPGALAQFQRMQTEFQLEPDTVCWNILLTAYRAANDMEGVSSQFSKMAEKGVEPNSHTFGILMGLCANKGDVSGARRLLQQAEERRVPITMVMLNTVAQAYISSGRVDLAEQLANQFLNMKVEGSMMRLWNSILMQYAFRIDHGAFKRVCRRMEEIGLEPDATTHAADLLRLALIGSAEKARTLLRRLHKEGSVRATEVHYAIVLLGYVKQRNLPMAVQILREAVARFPDSGLAVTLQKFEAEIAPDLDMAKENGIDLTAEERLKRVEMLWVESIANRNIAALASTLAADVSKHGVANSFTSWSHEYLIRQYGANGAIELARGLFDKHLVDRQADSHPNGQSTAAPAPLRLINSTMIANLNARQFKEVDECWKLALESGIKEASRLHIDEQVEQHLQLGKSSTEPPSPGSDKPKKIEIIPARRFTLSQPLSVYMRSLAARNEHERIAEVVAEVEEIGFELSSFNWSVYVRMLSESDKFELVSEAFRVHEKLFMPNWPGWNRLKNGQLFKPSSTPRGTYLLENRNAPEQSKHYLGREAGKYWSNMAPEFLQPSYLTVVYLSAALERMRNLSVVRGGTELDQLFHMAPQTLEAISKMPYLRDKFQGTMVRERSEAPEKEPQPFLDVKVARGGILGPGVKHKRLHAANPVEFDENVEAQEETAEQSSGEPISDPKQDGESIETPKKKEKKAPKPRVDPHQVAADAMAEEWQGILTPEELFDFQAQSRYNRTRPRVAPHKPVKPKKPETAPKHWKTPPGTKSPPGREAPKVGGSQRRHKKF